MTQDPQRHPLSGALDDAERTGEHYEVPVDLVRARVRRRRRVRAAGRGAVALVAVGVVALAGPALVGSVLGGTGHGPSSGAMGDWPAQFARCGMPVADVVATDSPVSTTLEVAPDRIDASRQWSAALRTDVDPAVTGEAWVVGTDVSLVSDGVVVGVQEGWGLRLLDDVLPVEPGSPVTTPLFTDLLADVRSCASYEPRTGGSSGEPGDPRVPAGVYDVVVTQTVAWFTADGTTHAAQASATHRVEVSDDDTPSELPGEPDPEQCGGDADALALLAGPEANPFAVTLDADVPTHAPTGEPLRFTVTATNEGTAGVEGWTGHPWVLLTRDGQVVAVPGAQDDIGLDATMPPGASTGYDAVTELEDCTTLGVGEHAGTSGGDPLPPGDYEVWVAMDFFLTTPAGDDGPESDRTDVHLVYGPWPVTLG